MHLIPSAAIKVQPHAELSSVKDRVQGAAGGPVCGSRAAHTGAEAAVFQEPHHPALGALPQFRRGFRRLAGSLTGQTHLGPRLPQLPLNWRLTPIDCIHGASAGLSSQICGPRRTGLSIESPNCLHGMRQTCSAVALFLVETPKVQTDLRAGMTLLHRAPRLHARQQRL
jgi:hypothetical protein